MHGYLAMILRIGGVIPKRYPSLPFTVILLHLARRPIETHLSSVFGGPMVPSHHLQQRQYRPGKLIYRFSEFAHLLIIAENDFSAQHLCDCLYIPAMG